MYECSLAERDGLGRFVLRNTFRFALPLAVDHELGCDQDVLVTFGGVFNLSRDRDRVIVDYGVGGCCVKAAAIFRECREQFFLCIDVKEAESAGDQVGHALTELEALRGWGVEVDVVARPTVGSVVSVLDGEVFVAIEVEVADVDESLIVVELCRVCEGLASFAEAGEDVVHGDCLKGCCASFGKDQDAPRALSCGVIRALNDGEHADDEVERTRGLGQLVLRHPG